MAVGNKISPLVVWNLTRKASERDGIAGRKPSSLFRLHVPPRIWALRTIWRDSWCMTLFSQGLLHRMVVNVEGEIQPCGMLEFDRFG
jgi:hypothetical protein